MPSVALVIRTPKLASNFAKASQPRHNVNRVIKLLTGIVSGAIAGGLTIQTSTSDPVAAAATATITYASIANTDTIVILGVTLTCVTGTPSTDEFKKETDATTTAANLVTAINANTTLLKYVTATSALGVVTITVNMKGALGNYLASITNTGTGFSLAQWSGGTGGPATAAVQIRS